jgi:hypothetical protein
VTPLQLTAKEGFDRPYLAGWRKVPRIQLVLQEKFVVANIATLAGNRYALVVCVCVFGNDVRHACMVGPRPGCRVLVTC